MPDEDDFTAFDDADLDLELEPDTGEANLDGDGSAIPGLEVEDAPWPTEEPEEPEDPEEVGLETDGDDH